jgi:hypothetical protein
MVDVGGRRAGVGGQRENAGIDGAGDLGRMGGVKSKSVKYETREPSASLKRTMREVNAGRGLTRIGSTREEIHEWTQRVYERALKNKKV